MTTTPRIGLLGFAFVLAVASAASAGDWPQFRGPGGIGSAEDGTYPTRWSGTENVRWKAELPGRGLSNPVIAAGKVYVTASSGYKESRLHVLCFDQATGKKLWERQLTSTGGTQCHPKTCMAAPTPVTDGERVYAYFATGDLACLDADGDLLWYRSLVGDYPDVTNQVGMAASPVLAGNTLLVPLENVGDSFALGVDKYTGKNRWKGPRIRDINWVTPLVRSEGGRTEALFQSKDELTAYDAETGEKRWAYRAAGLSTVLSPVAVGDAVLAPGGECVALRPAAGKPAPEVLWKTTKLRGGFATPLHYRGRLYSIAGSAQNLLVCVDAATGKELWSERVEGPFGASPVAADGKVYVANEAGVTTVIKVGDKPEVLASNELGEKAEPPQAVLLATPALADGAVFLRTDKHLYCIAEKKAK